MVEAWTSRQTKPGIFRNAARNRDAIAAVLTRVLPDRGTVLEIGSGSGEHAHHFSELFPHLTWQPSDPDQLNVDSILAWVDAAGRPNLRPPLSINASDVILPLESADAVMCVNVIHISPWDATEGLMRNAALVLPPEGCCTFTVPSGLPASTAPSNGSFDRSLRGGTNLGVRDLEDVVLEADKNGLSFIERIEMPANNQSLIFRNPFHPSSASDRVSRQVTQRRIQLRASVAGPRLAPAHQS